MTNVFQNFVSNLCLVNDGHKACLNLFYNAAKNERLKILKDCTLQFLNDNAEIGRIRIELHIDDVLNKIIMLLDLKCPIDMPACFENADTNNLNKYQPLKSKVQKVKSGNSVTLIAIISGSLGCVPEETTSQFKKIGINSARVKKLQEDISITYVQLESG